MTAHDWLTAAGRAELRRGVEQDDPPRWRVAAAQAEYEEGVRCVVLPCCALTMSADHADVGGGGGDDTYTCPQCSPHDAVVQLLDALEAAEARAFLLPPHPCPHHPDVDARRMWGCPDCLRELRNERNEARAAAATATEARAAKLREALAAVLAWGVEHDDPRIGYITVQVDRVVEREAREVLAKEPTP